MNYLSIAGAFVTLAGSAFILFAAIGLVRMPDLYTRIQTGTKASTLGTILVLAGLAMIHPEWALKLVLLIVFVAITNPVSSHVLARAAAKNGEPFEKGTIGTEIPDQSSDNSLISQKK